VSRGPTFILALSLGALGWALLVWLTGGIDGRILGVAVRARGAWRPLTLGLHQASASDLQFSDVLAGVAFGGHFKPRISVDASAGQIIALLEVYGASRGAFDNVAIEFALHGEDDVNYAVTRARVQAAATSGVPKGIAQGALQLGHAGPGRYTVTAALLVNGKPAGFTKRDLVVRPAR